MKYIIYYKNMEYNCNQCKKKYSSQQSLCNHNKKFHSKKNETISNIDEFNIDEFNINKCDYCKKKFINRYTLRIHLLNNCYIKKYNDININNNNNNNKETDLIKLELNMQVADKQ